MKTKIGKEEVLEIFKKYAWKHFGGSWNAGDFMTRLANASKYWNDEEHMRIYSGDPKPPKWLNDEVQMIFDWWVDMDGGNDGKPKWDYKSKKEFEDAITAHCREKDREKSRKAYEARKRREEKKKQAGLELKKKMHIGDVWIAETSRGQRGIQVMEIEAGSFSGFYLDNDDKRVPRDAEEKEGFIYYPCWGVMEKFEWDGKTFKRTKTYDSKMYKFLVRKVDNAVILKK